MANERKLSRVRKRKSKKRKRLLLVIVPFLILIGATTAYGAYLYNKAADTVNSSYEDDGRTMSDLRDAAVDPTEDNVSILFIGVDQSEHRANEGNSRSDALMLATLNNEEKSVKLVSIPRDTYVYIPEVGYKTKINHAHAYGGAPATIGAVEELLQVPVDYFVRVDFNAFVDVIDAIGGITAEVPYEFTESNSDDKKNSIHLYPGEQLLNGEEALALARTRKMDNDLERGKRQQEILKAVITKVASAQSVTKYDNVIQAVGDNMTTNLTFSQMKSFLSYGMGGNIDIETVNLKGYDVWTDAYYFELDATDLANKVAELRAHLELEPLAPAAAGTTGTETTPPAPAEQPAGTEATVPPVEEPVTTTP